MTVIPAVRALPAGAARPRARARGGGAPPARPLPRRSPPAAPSAAAGAWCSPRPLLVLVGLRRAPPRGIDGRHEREAASSRRSDPVRVDDARINTHFAGTNTLVLLVEAAARARSRSPRSCARSTASSARLEHEPGVGKATSYVDFLETHARAR